MKMEKEPVDGGPWDFLHGHKIVYLNNEWVYADDHTPALFNKRPCPRCGRMPVPHPTERIGMDYCIQNLPNVRAACCGHGVEPGYIIFDNGIRIEIPYGEDVVEKFKKFNLVTLKVWNLNQLINSVDAVIEADLDDWKGVKRDLLRRR